MVDKMSYRDIVTWRLMDRLIDTTLLHFSIAEPNFCFEKRKGSIFIFLSGIIKLDVFYDALQHFEEIRSSNIEPDKMILSTIVSKVYVREVIVRDSTWFHKYW